MSMETDTILRAVLYHCKITDDVENIRTAIEAMCSEDVVAAVEKKVAAVKARSQKERQKI
jgi:hypothetical protein